MRRAFVLLAALAFHAIGTPTAQAAGVSVEEASAEAKDQAQEAFLAGDRAFDVQNYEEALRHFRVSHEVVASPNSRLMVARCLLELGRLDESYDEYLGVLADAADDEDYVDTREAAKKEQDALLNRLAWVKLEWGGRAKHASLEVGGRTRSVKRMDRPIAVTPGTTRIVATSETGEEASATVHVAAGRTAHVSLSTGKHVTVGTPPAKPPSTTVNEKGSRPHVAAKAPHDVAVQDSGGGSLKPLAYVAGGVGLVGMATFGTFGYLSGRHYDALEDDCRDGRCPTASQDDIAAGKQGQLVANIGLGVGIAGLGTGIVLFLLDDDGERPVAVDVGHRSISVRGVF